MTGKKFWKTIDGGASWQEVYNFNDSKGEYRSLYFLDELNGFINKYNGAFFTGDGGITWKKLGLDGSATENYLGSIFFYSEEIGFLTGSHELATYNAAGKTIQFYYGFYDNGTAFYPDVHFVSADTGYATNGRMVMKTTDRGNTWKVELKTPAAELCELGFLLLTLWLVLDVRNLSPLFFQDNHCSHIKLHETINANPIRVQHALK